ncbi:MAG: ATP-binding protein [Caldilineaceae bacterium]
MTIPPLDLRQSQGVNIGNYGPITQYFQQPDYATLADLYVPPDAVYERVRSREFVGRRWLIAQIDAFLRDPRRKSGVLMLEGEAGVGKSALMAHLVQQRNYLHLFAEQLPGDANVIRALQSLGSQLVTRHQLHEYTQRDTLPAIAGFPDFLERLLRAAAARLPADQKIVIVCDGLDEAGVAANGNVFGLPQVLPEGVYLLLAQRPQPVALSFKNATAQIIRLDPAGAENQEDVQAYLRQAAHQPAIAQQLAERGYSPICWPCCP